MSNTQENLTDKEMEDLPDIVADTLVSICTMADKHNIDRDSLLKYFACMLTAFAESASIQNYEASHACNCKHNNSSRDNEPCCRCDSRQTNTDRIRNMSDKELAEWINTKNTCEQCAYEPESVCMKEPCVNGILKWLQSEAE